MTTEIDWECGHITNMLKSAVYSIALCTCEDDSSPCALHQADAFKVWLCASGITLAPKANGVHCAEHIDSHEDGDGRPAARPDKLDIAWAFYYGRIPWSVVLRPRARELEVTYVQSQTTRPDTWFEYRRKRHVWERTHNCNLPYIQFIMAMLMPRPDHRNDAGPDEVLAKAFEEVF